MISGWVAKWLCSGLQIRLRRFDSDPSLHLLLILKIYINVLYNGHLARVVELVDTRDLKSLEGNFVPVRVRPRAPTETEWLEKLKLNS